MTVKVFELGGIVGRFRLYERYNDGKVKGPWRLRVDKHNIVNNQFYNDLFALMSGTGGINFNVGALALGYGNAPTFARPDTGLAAEWVNPAATLSAQLNSGTSYTSASVNAIPMTLPVGTVVQFGAGQTATLTTQANPGATSLAFTGGLSGGAATQNYTVGSAVNVTTGSWTPQRASPSLTTPTTTDPPAMTWSFYFPAAANQVTIIFTEAGLLYNNPSLTAGGAGKFMSHVAFSYTKNINTDVRVDYTLTRALT